MNLENEQLLRSRMEELKIPEDKIDQVLFGFGEMDKSDNSGRGILDRLVEEKEIKEQIVRETDWRKLASLRARLISLDL